MSEASCRGIIDPAILFEGFEDANLGERLEIIKMCMDCPVKSNCKEYAESFPDSEGVHAGQFYRKGQPKDPFKVRKTGRVKVAT